MKTIDRLSASISQLTLEIFGLRLQIKEALGWLKSHSSFITKSDLLELEKKIMSALTEEFKKIKSDIAEGTTELTARIKDLETSLGNDTLSQESREALEEVKAAAVTLATIVPNPDPANPTTRATPA